MSGTATNLVGIDLGTTMSAIAYVDSMGHATTLPNQDGEPLTASAVYLDGKDALVGKAAKAAAAYNPSKVATLVKRSMGSSLYDREVDGRRLRPETLSAIILRKLRNDAEKRIGPIGKAVITVPAFFDDTRRHATEIAGRIAGLDVLEIVNEPTAAGLAFCLRDRFVESDPVSHLIAPGKSFTGLVYDLGGGTFDVTIIRLSDKGFETLATDGEVQLGGKDWDDVIIEFIARQFRKKHGVDPSDDALWRESVAGLAESAKTLLSQLSSVPIDATYQGHSINEMISRSRFAEASRDLLNRTRVVTKLVASNQAKLTWEQIDKILLVGGSTRMPMVRQMLQEATGMEPDDRLDPDHVVAHGAALYATLLAAQAGIKEIPLREEFRGRLAEVEVIDVNSHSLGIAIRDQRSGKKMNHIMIPKNSSLPVASRQVFHLPKAGQQSVRIEVLEGEAPEASANIRVGECHVRDLPSDLPQKSPIQVRLSYACNGRVNVMALDMTSGKLVQADLQQKRTMTEDEIQTEIEFVNSLNIR